jgi:hypothetical protein
LVRATGAVAYPTRAATDAALAATVKADILVVKSNRQPLSMKVWRVTRVSGSEKQTTSALVEEGSEKEATRITTGDAPRPQILARATRVERELDRLSSPFFVQEFCRTQSRGASRSHGARLAWAASRRALRA